MHNHRNLNITWRSDIPSVVYIDMERKIIVLEIFSWPLHAQRDLLHSHDTAGCYIILILVCIARLHSIQYCFICLY